MMPPRVARWLLRKVLPGLDRDVVVGDLDDEFHREIAPRRSRPAAHLWYWRQVMSSMPDAARMRARFPWSDFVRDTSHGLRLLARNPAFALASIATLTLAIGATSAVLTVANAVLMRPLPYAEPDRLVSVMESDRSRESASGNVSWPDFFDYQAQNQTLSGLAAYTSGSRTLTVPGQPPEVLRAVLVTANFFDVLGVPAGLGRTFQPQDSPTEAAPVVILTDAAWRTRYGADPNIVGKAMTLNARPTTIVGVLPADFQFTLPGEAELWLPVRPATEVLERRFFHSMDTVGRLEPGVTREQAEADLDRIARGFAAVDARAHSASSAQLPLLRHRTVRNVRPLILILASTSVLVLLVACANIAGLLLARNAARGPEMSVRRAMGAGRARLFRQMLAENIALAVPGGLLGIVAGQWMMQVLVAAIPAGQRARLPYIATLGLDWRAVAITAGLTIVASLVFGLAPAWLSARRDHLVSMRGVAGAGAREMRLQSSLIALQVALAVVLLVGAGLIGRSLGRLLEVSPGFDADRILSVSMALPQTPETTPGQIAVAHDELLGRMRALPGVTGAASINLPPLSGRIWTGTFVVRGDASGRETPTLVRTASRDYFDTMGIPLIAGRPFGPSDTTGSPPVVIVNERLVRAMAGGDPIGRRLAFPVMPDRAFEIVGVVGDELFHAIDAEPEPVMYMPFSQEPGGQFSIVLRAEGDPSRLEAPARAAIADFNLSIPVYRVRTMKEILDASEPVFQRTSVLTLIGGFAAAGLLLAAIGVYGVLAQMVVRQRREIGVRLALGAGTREIVLSVVRRLSLAVTGGLTAGLLGSIFLGRALESLLFGIQPFDPTTVAAVIAVLGVTALVASLVPIRRAVSVDPVEALRSE